MFFEKLKTVGLFLGKAIDFFFHEIFGLPRSFGSSEEFTKTEFNKINFKRLFKLEGLFMLKLLTWEVCLLVSVLGFAMLSNLFELSGIRLPIEMKDGWPVGVVSTVLLWLFVLIYILAIFQSAKLLNNWLWSKIRKS